MSTPQTIGRYEILEELGRGAMGAVYRAKDPAMGRTVAIKTIISTALDSDQSGEFRERFFREARAAGALAHPGIVPVFDVGEYDGQPFLVMEYVHGWTLANIDGRRERLDLNRMCEIGQKIAEALGYAHQRGVVHRDIKPANILLTSKETYGVEQPKIADFGIAKLTEGDATLTGKMLGTPAFMPPEQFTGAQVDGRADLYSLGVVLYWLATGEQPFPGEGLTTVLYKVVHTEPIPPRKLNPALPAKFESIILKCMEKDPAARYQTGEELAHELGELRTGKTMPGAPAASPRTMAVTADTDATLIVGTPAAPAILASAPASVVTTQAAQPVTSTALRASKGNSRIGLVAAAIIAVAASVGWYVVHARQKPAPPPEAASSPSITTPAPAVAVPQSAAAAAPTTAAADSKPVTAIVNPGPGVNAKQPSVAASPKAGAGIPAKATAVAPNIQALGFDPMTLDPKQNARLKIDAGGMPRGLDFTVEMNGRVYSHNSGGNGQESFVPPGIHEFRVSAKSGAVQQISNTVSAEFLPKKKLTLKVELRMVGKPVSAGTPQGLYSDTQIVIELSSSKFW
jgi:tRNA A-37 threonylcarbamoyl transferase component Bud32